MHLSSFPRPALTMAVMFAHTAPMHEGGNFETAKEIIDFALNMNLGLRLGGNIGMVHLSPFVLILL